MQLADFAYSQSKISLILEQKQELVVFDVSEETLQFKFRKAFVYRAILGNSRPAVTSLVDVVQGRFKSF